MSSKLLAIERAKATANYNQLELRVSIMSYIITAEVPLNIEENHRGDIEKVKARTLSKRGGYITFDIPGNFHEQQELTKKLCNDLIDAGFVTFSLRHSY